MFKKNKGIPVVEEPTPLQEADEMIEAALLPYRQTVCELDDANVLLAEYVLALDTIIKSLQEEKRQAQKKLKDSKQIVDNILEVIGD